MTDPSHFAIDIEPDEDIDNEIGLVLDFMAQMAEQDVDMDNLMGAMLWAIMLTCQDEYIN